MKNKKEHFTENPSKSSKYDVSVGASSKYGWGKAKFKESRHRNPNRPFPPPYKPPINIPPNKNKYIINDFRGGCESCDIVKHPDINKFVLKSSIPPPPDMSRYILKSKMPVCPDMSRYILKSEVPPCPNMSKYILKSKVPACPDVFRHLSNDSMRGNIYSCNVETPLMPQRCPRIESQMEIMRNIRNHPDFYKYEMREEYKKGKKNKVCKDNIQGFKGLVGTEFATY